MDTLDYYLIFTLTGYGVCCCFRMKFFVEFPIVHQEDLPETKIYIHFYVTTFQ